MKEEALKEGKSFIDSVSYLSDNFEGFDGVIKSFQDAKENGRKSLEITVDMTHGGYVNQNYRFYRPQDMEEALETLTKPYRKPVYGGSHPGIFSNAKEIGRVTDAKFEMIENAEEGKPKCKIVAKAIITDQEAIEKIKDGRYLTVSSGATCIDYPTCSICGKKIDDEECNHRKGQTYKVGDSKEEKLCYWITNGLEYKEFSFVGEPADASKTHFAGVVSARVVDTPDFTQDVKTQQDAIQNSNKATLNDNKEPTPAEPKAEPAVEPKAEPVTEPVVDNKELETLKADKKALEEKVSKLEAELKTANESVNNIKIELNVKEGIIKTKADELEKLNQDKKSLESIYSNVVDSYKATMLDQIKEIECQTNQDLINSIESADSQEAKDKIINEKVDTYRNLALSDMENSLKELKLKRPNVVSNLQKLNNADSKNTNVKKVKRSAELTAMLESLNIKEIK